MVHYSFQNHVTLDLNLGELTGISQGRREGGVGFTSKENSSVQSRGMRHGGPQDHPCRWPQQSPHLLEASTVFQDTVLFPRQGESILKICTDDSKIRFISYKDRSNLISVHYVNMFIFSF